MIKDVLVPEKIGNYYLFAKRIVGFHVDTSEVTATQVYLKGSTATVENVFKESIGADQALSREEKVAQVVKSILNRVGKYDAVYTAMPSSQIIFKSLLLPFLNYEKIKMVVGYEVEPLLPFALDEAMIDFIITKQFPKQGNSEVLVAAVQKSALAEHISFFEQVGVHPQKIGVDFFEFYGLYATIAQNKKMKETIGIVNIGLGSTHVALVQNSQLKSVRVLPKGMNDFIAVVSKSSNISLEDARNAISTFGLTKEQDQAYHSHLVDALKMFWSSIQFTLGSFAAQGEVLEVKKFLLSGSGSNIPGLDEFIVKQAGGTCDFFQVTPLFADGKIKIKKNVGLHADHVMSLGVALPSEVTNKFNLLPSHMSEEKEVSLLTKQVLFAGLFFISVIVALLLHSSFQMRKLHSEIQESQDEVVAILKERFDLPRDLANFDMIVEEAVSEVTKEERALSLFSAQSHFLKYLLELHALDTEGLGLQVKRVVITKDTMTLDAKVKDFKSVSKFEKELRKSKLFKYAGSVQKTDFTMKIPLAKKR